MYIKFCRWHVEDKKEKPDENLSSKLSVELEGGKGQQVGGNERLYRCGCFVLTGICLLLLLIVIFLSLKHGSQVCTVQECHQQFSLNQDKHLGCQQCARGWLPYGKSCYFLSTVRLSWADSQKNCSSGGGSLAVISSRDIQHFLTQTGNLGYWIGLRQTESKWNWVNNTQPEKFYWSDSTGQAKWSESTKKKDCAFLSSDDPEENNWIKASCEAQTYFICQLQV
uniref:C-type lectin domain-containing protein n=1 Tax=Iconisemion striatum TaxID=60296 RepID=A0A1A7Z0S8_9TELE